MADKTFIQFRAPLNLNFVLCHRFHGATAFALLLNNHSQVSSLGDNFPRIVPYEEICGCGEKVSNCEFWRLIEEKCGSMRVERGATIYPLVPNIAPARINSALSEVISLAALVTTPRLWFGAKPFVQFHLDFINAVNEYNGSAVFVNGGKSMKTVLAIKSILGRRANIHIIHLYRDPRGFYCSEKKSDVGMTIERSAKRWLSYHRRVTRIVKPLCKARYLAVRYEDLCDHPEATMQKVFAFIGVEYEDVFHPSGEHHLLGNSSMERFDGTMRKSEKWREELTPDSQAAILSATNPLAQQMGYRDDQYERNMDRGLRSGGD